MDLLLSLGFLVDAIDSSLVSCVELGSGSRTFAALGVTSMVMSFPFSSFLGFIKIAALLVLDVENAKSRGRFCDNRSRRTLVAGAGEAKPDRHRRDILDLNMRRHG